LSKTTTKVFLEEKLSLKSELQKWPKQLPKNISNADSFEKKLKENSKNQWKNNSHYCYISKPKIALKWPKMSPKWPNDWKMTLWKKLPKDLSNSLNRNEKEIAIIVALVIKKQDS